MKKWVSVILVLFGANAFAANQNDVKKFYIGGEGGLQIQSKNRTAIYGGGLGFMLGRHFTLGAFYLHSKLKSISFGIGSSSAKQEYYGGEMALVLARVIRFGARAGMTKFTSENAVRTTTGTRAAVTTSNYFFAGPVFAIDIPLGRHFSIGPQATYAALFANGKHIGVFHGVGTLKLRF